MANNNANKKEVVQAENINPSYYSDKCSLECFEAMELMFDIDDVLAMCKLVAFKYIWRYKNKNGLEDLYKAKEYIEHAREVGNRYYTNDEQTYYDSKLETLASIVDKKMKELEGDS